MAAPGSKYQIYVRIDGCITILYFRTKEWAEHVYKSYTIPSTALHGLIELNKKRPVVSWMAGDAVYKTINSKTK